MEEYQGEEEVVPDGYSVIDGDQGNSRGNHRHHHTAVDGKVIASVDFGSILKFQRDSLHEPCQDEDGGGESHRHEDEYDRKWFVDKPQGFDQEEERDDRSLQGKHDSTQEEHVDQRVEPVGVPAYTVGSHGTKEEYKGHAGGGHQQAVGEVPGKALVYPYRLVGGETELLREGERCGENCTVVLE